MIAYKYRFHGHASIKYLLKNGKSIKRDLLTIKYITNPKRSSYRASVIVSKKIFKRAVKRNLIRRRIYEIIRTNFEPNLNIDLAVIIYSPEIINQTHNELKESIVSALNNLKDSI